MPFSSVAAADVSLSDSMSPAPWVSHPAGAVGAIDFRGVVLRYHPARPPAVRSLSLSVMAGEHIAICGRTGCGKSSLLRVLPRLYPIEEGAYTRSLSK